jgi:hypothetical protein
MSQQDTYALGVLGGLYESLQALNAALCAGDGSTVFAVVERLNGFALEAEALTVEDLDADGRKLAQQMARRIREMNEINRSICQGNMRVLQNGLENLEAISTDYQPDGVLTSHLLAVGVNLSA